MLVCTLLDCPTAKHMSYYCFYHVYWKESKTTISTCWLKFPVIIVFLFSLDAINLQTNIHIIWHIEHASEIVENSRKPWSTFSGNFSLFVSTTADEWMPMCCRKIVQPFSLFDCTTRGSLLIEFSHNPLAQYGYSDRRRLQKPFNDKPSTTDAYFISNWLLVTKHSTTLIMFLKVFFLFGFLSTANAQLSAMFGNPIQADNCAEWTECMFLSLTIK